ncbi:MAG: carboxypeptidase-like regulatory domain-containing protein, partial [Tannerella sp.]|nr:carboxypeptidase-like regulatory domain-containing protein [Tannerella sp.]
MSKVFFCIVTLLSGYSIADAQTIQGKVTDKNQEPVEYATVVLQTPDSVYVSAAYTDSTGNFSIQADFSAYRLIVQHLIYETHEKYYSNEYELVIELTEKENRLGEVVVKGERPVVKLVDGKITYDMPLLLSGKAVSNAYESMLQLPGVREQSGSLVLAGASNVTVIINGQVTSM